MGAPAEPLDFEEVADAICVVVVLGVFLDHGVVLAVEPQFDRGRLVRLRPRTPPRR